MQTSRLPCFGSTHNDNPAFLRVSFMRRIVTVSAMSDEGNSAEAKYSNVFHPVHVLSGELSPNGGPMKPNLFD
jgi:hypothetical protein